MDRTRTRLDMELVRKVVQALGGNDDTTKEESVFFSTKDIVEVFLQSHDHDGRVKGDTETVVDGKYSLSFVATRSGRYRAEVSLPTVLLWLAGSFHVCMLCQCGGLRC